MREPTFTRILSLLAIFTIYTASLQAQECQWAKQSEGNIDELTVASVTDGAGNTYVTGSFDGVQIVFGSTTLVNPAMAAGNPSAFLVKYDAAGDVLWAKLLGGGVYDAANSITMDAAGKLYIYGNFYNPTISFGATTLDNASGYDNFLLKSDTSGNPIWARVEHESVTASGTDYAIGVAADDSDHVVVTGTYDSSITIGGIHLASLGGQGGVYVAKYDSAGNVLWAITNSGDGMSFANALAIDGSGNIYNTGFSGSMSLSFGDSTIANIGGSDIFLAKFSPGGTIQWVRDIVDSCNSDIGDIDADNAGNVYAVGNFMCPTITFGAYTLTNAAYGSGNPNEFVVQYSPAGHVNWAQRGGGASGDGAFTVDVTSQNLAVGGASLGTPSVFGGDSLNQAGIFLAEYSNSGAVRWLKSASAPAQGYISALSHDAMGNLYASGYFNGGLQIDGHTLTDTSTSMNGELFTASFTNPTMAVPEVKTTQQLTLYPNPATSRLTISSGATTLDQVVITDLLGHEIYHLVPDAPVALLNIDVSALPAGMYLARINGAEVRKFVKD